MSSQNNIIAFQGQHGAYSEAACNSSFPKMETLPCETFEDVFGAVMEGNAQLAMIPIENSQAGRVADIHNLLANSTLNIVGEHFQRVRHQLLGISGTTLDKIRTVSSHAQAVSQCRNFINNKNLQPIVVGDTAGAAAEIAKNNDPSASAIASKLAADIYKLIVLSHDIEDSEKIISIEKATNNGNYLEKDLLNLYTRYRFSINQLITVLESHKMLAGHESRALLYQGFLISKDTVSIIELLKILKEQ